MSDFKQALLWALAPLSQEMFPSLFTFSLELEMALSA